jgi:hypothetical protein
MWLLAALPQEWLLIGWYSVVFLTFPCRRCKTTYETVPFDLVPLTAQARTLFPLPFKPVWTTAAAPSNQTTNPTAPGSLQRPCRAQRYAPFFADKAGSWALLPPPPATLPLTTVATDTGADTALVLRQVVSERPGANRWAAMNLAFPLTVVGTS